MDQRRAERRVWLALGGVIAAILVLGIGSLLRGRSGGDSLPIIASVPDFHLRSSTGRAVSRADLLGDLWVADFIFTNCAGVCPVLSARMAEVQKALGERSIDARLVSITVDPARDSPEALRAYAERFGADPDVWWFLTGERDELYELIGKGFLLSVAERSPDDAPADDGHDLITHSDRFVLVDREGRIRSYYHGTDRESVEALLDALETLARG